METQLIVGNAFNQLTKRDSDRLFLLPLKCQKSTESMWKESTKKGEMVQKNAIHSIF
jgi:hypothetical protein